MTDSIQALIKHKYRLLHLLTPDLKDHLKRLKKLKLDDFSKYSSLISEHNRPVNIDPGTVSSFLFGCDQTFYGNIDHRCTSLCLQDSCKKQVWIVSGNKLQKDNECTSSEAYLYIPSNFVFTKRHERVLRKGGVKTVSLIKTKFSKHTVVDIIQIDKEDIEEEKPEIDQKHKISIFLYILIVIIIVIMIWLLAS
uniref:Uncharacterized protein n=1 Tax=Pithovirus LCPAC403 TaxID=2506596 RepID=A0A481ZC54_9VIRU|nr:MAG: hypothetical protein LCPAC403_00560 [Pithovirus LCPAC403]